MATGRLLVLCALLAGSCATQLRSHTFTVDDDDFETAERWADITVPWCRKTAVLTGLNDQQALLWSGKGHDKIAKSSGSSFLNDLWVLSVIPDQNGEPHKGGYEWRKVDVDEAHTPTRRWKSYGDTLNGKFYAFGGDDGNSFENDLWSLDLVKLENLTDPISWHRVVYDPSTPVPNPRRGHVFVSMPQSNSVVLVGGRMKGHVCLHDAWAFSDQTHVWTQLPMNTGPCRWGHTGTLAQDPVTGKDLLVIFGGRYENSDHEMVYLNDLWFLTLDDPSVTWTKVQYKGEKLPHTRDHHTMSYHKESHSLFLFGGRITPETTPALHDLWRFSLSDMEWVEMKPKGFLPSTRYVQSSTMIDSHMVIFGGEHFKKDQTYKKDHKLNDVWLYSIKTNRWTQLSVSNCEANDENAVDDDDTMTLVFYVVLTAAILTAFLVLGNRFQARGAGSVCNYCVDETAVPGGKPAVQLMPFRRGYEPIK